MSEWKRTQVCDFLKERVGRYKPNDPIVKKLKRLEKIDFSGCMHFSDKSSKTDMIIAKKGDLVISGINVAKGALAVYDGSDNITATIHYSSYHFDDEKIDVEYFKRFLKSPKFIQLLKDQVKGGIKTEIKPKHLLPLKIDLPDIDIQKSIVDFFQRTENEIGDINFQISKQHNFIKQLRQSILQEAVEGKLTAEWRKQNPELISGENHAARLLEKIKTEKEQLLKEGNPSTALRTRIKKQKTLPPISEDEKLFDLPEGWVWCRFGEVINLISGQHIETHLYNIEQKGFPYLTGPADFGEIFPIINKWTEYPKVFARLNDILVTVKGSGVGKINLVNIDKVVISRQLMAVRNTKLINYFLYLFLQNYFNILQKLKKGLIPGIGRDDLLYMSFALPTLEEQQAIVEKVNQLMAKINALEEQVKSRKEQAEQLMQAVLREAFNGETEKGKKQTKKVDYFKRTILAAEIVHELYKEPTFGHLKFQKLLFLCEKIGKVDIPSNYKKQAAGPHDSQMMRSVDKQLKSHGWFTAVFNGKGFDYHPLEKAGEHSKYYKNYFSAEHEIIHWLIKTFQKARSSKVEIVATLYAVWEDLKQSGSAISDDILINKFYEWSEQKKKYTQDQVLRALNWMKDNEIHPQ